MFPEGTRSKSGNLQEPLNGTALLALKSECPVIPIAILGPYRLFKDVTVKIGKPIYFDQLYGQKIRGPQLNQLSRTIMQEIAKLLGNIEYD